MCCGQTPTSFFPHTTTAYWIFLTVDKVILQNSITQDQPVHSFKAHDDALSCLEILKEDTSFITGSHDSFIKFWDIRKLTTLLAFEQNVQKYDESVMCMTLLPKKPAVYVGGADGALRIYEWFI